MSNYTEKERETEEELNKKNSSNKRCGRGRNKKRAPQSKGTQKNYPVTKGNNDPNWYFSDKGLMDTVSKFAFNNFLGYGKGVGSNTIPYAMQIYINPAAACSMDWSDDDNNRTAGINMAALKLYTTLSAQSGKTSQYGPEDLAILMLALGDLISFVEYGRRTLGLAFTYNNRNWNYPSNIIEACGFDNSVLTNLAQKRMDFNITLNTINKISFPANIAYFSKCASLYQNVFLDSLSPMAQSYIYLPYTIWELDEKSSSSGSVLKTVGLWTSIGATITWDEYMTKLNTMISAIMMSSTFNYIYGDVLNYAAKTNVPMLHLDLVSEDYAVVPVYNELALTQIHNMNAFGAPIDAALYKETSHETQVNTTGNDVIGDAGTGTVKYTPHFYYWNLYIQDLYIDALESEPDVNVRIDMTRYALRASYMMDAYPAGSATPTSVLTDVTLPDHYVVCFNIKSESGDSGAFYTANNAEGGAWYAFASKLTQFDWAPIIYVCGNADYKEDLMMYGDLDYYTSIGESYLSPVNKLCYQGLFELR